MAETIIPSKGFLSNYPRVSLFSGRRRDWSSPDVGLINPTNNKLSSFFGSDRADMAWMAMTKTYISPPQTATLFPDD